MSTDNKKEQTEEVKKQHRRRGWIELGVYAVILAVVFIVFHFILMLGRIPTESMEPNLMTHDWFLGERGAYSEEEPERGDIIVFYSDEFGMSLCKRVIGLPKEEVSFVGGHVYIDGKPLNESEYLSEDVVTESEDTFTVPEDCVFVLGDNREVSDDARYWEDPYVSYEDIQARIFFVIPFHKLPWF